MLNTKTTQELGILVFRCKQFGPYYTAQTLLGFIDDILKNTRNMGYTIACIKLKKDIMNTNVQETALRVIYKNILNTIRKHNMRSIEALNLERFVELLQETSTY